MNTLDTQIAYWNRIANTKTFTHPLDLNLLSTYFQKEFKIMDYGCGYGRISKELSDLGFTNVIGLDTSVELVSRGRKQYPLLTLEHIIDVKDLDTMASDFDAVILFAVLTCVPSNGGQTEIIARLKNRLRQGGLLYISDYYLQDGTREVKRYQSLNNDPENYGVFKLPEGVTFRHHTKPWIKELLRDFTILEEKKITVQTMNGHSAEAFQVLAQHNITNSQSALT